MKKLNINSVPMTTLILFIICVVITAALAVTNYITKGKIAKLEEKAANDAKKIVLAGEYTSAKTDDGKEYFIVKEGDTVKGYITTASANGYGGEIKVMVGVDTKCTITGVSILSASDETPGLGANVTKKDFYNQFIGKKRNVVLVKNQPNSEKNEIKAVTSATISSTAVTNAVNEAMEVLKTVCYSNNTKDGE